MGLAEGGAGDAGIRPVCRTHPPPSGIRTGSASGWRSRMAAGLAGMRCSPASRVRWTGRPPRTGRTGRALPGARSSSHCPRPGPVVRQRQRDHLRPALAEARLAAALRIIRGWSPTVLRTSPSIPDGGHRGGPRVRRPHRRPQACDRGLRTAPRRGGPRSADRLLVFDVADGWPPLCEFLVSPSPARPFPRSTSAKRGIRSVGRLLRPSSSAADRALPLSCMTRPTTRRRTSAAPGRRRWSTLGGLDRPEDVVSFTWTA